MRRKRNIKRAVQTDYKHGSAVAAKAINYLMLGGKKTVAQKILYGCFDIIKEKTGKDPLEVFELAVKNTSPLVEIKSKRIGGANYQVPREVRGERKLALSLRWLILTSRAKKGKPMAQKFAEEVLLAANNEGAAVKKRQDTQRMAEANKAFAHMSW